MVAGPDTGRVAGSLAGGRTFQCVDCAFAITLLPRDEVPECPRCGGTSFAPGSMFSQATTEVRGAPPEAKPIWLDHVRASVSGKGPHLAWDDGESIIVVPVGDGFTRVGRSIQADIHLGGPTVSRRHALIHREDDVVTVVDDHSLNGVFVNGESVDWHQLEDDDEIELGGFHLHFVAR